MKLGYLNLVIWWILLHQSCRFFSLHRGRKTGGLLFHFILSKIVAFGTGSSFSCFSGEPRKARSGVEGELRSSCAPCLARACLRSPEKRQKTTTTTPVLQNKEKWEKTGEDDKICSRAMGGINYVCLHDVLASRSYPIFTLESKYGGRSRRRSDNEETVF